MKRFLLMVAGLAACIVAQAQSTDTIRLAFIGDVMSHYPQVTAALQKDADPALEDSFDYAPCYKYVKPYFDSADFVIANMEFPVGVRPYTGYPQFSAPVAAAKEAQRSGVDLFLAANNHICDKGLAGMDSTYSIYTRMGVPFTGFYRSESEEIEKCPLTVSIKGLNIAIINFTYGTNGLPVPAPYRVSKMDSTSIRAAVARAKEQQADYIIAMPHWGEEYHLDYSAEQQRWAGLLHEWGVDAIIGGHPHVVQAVEESPCPVTLYSLGNFVSNMSVANAQIGMLFELTLVKEEDGSVKVEGYRPVYLWCARKGMLEENYVVLPIPDWLGRRDEFRIKEEYDKMEREWENIKKKFGL